MISSEDKLQSTMVLWFSQNKPKDRGCLWSVRNSTFSKLDGVKQKAMGMFPGASDLQYFKNKIFLGIEVKVIGSKHNIQHLERQIYWGQNVVNNGGRYYFCYSLLGFISLIEGINPVDCWTIKQMEQKIKKVKTKNIKL